MTPRLLRTFLRPLTELSDNLKTLFSVIDWYQHILTDHIVAVVPSFDPQGSTRVKLHTIIKL